MAKWILFCLWLYFSKLSIKLQKFLRKLSISNPNNNNSHFSCPYFNHFTELNMSDKNYYQGLLTTPFPPPTSTVIGKPVEVPKPESAADRLPTQSALMQSDSHTVMCDTTFSFCSCKYYHKTLALICCSEKPLIKDMLLASMLVEYFHHGLWMTLHSDANHNSLPQIHWGSGSRYYYYDYYRLKKRQKMKIYLFFNIHISIIDMDKVLVNVWSYVWMHPSTYSSSVFTN